MREVDRLEILACFEYLRDEPMGVRQGPLRVEKNGVGLSRDNDGGNLESRLVAVDDLGRQWVGPSGVQSDLHRTALQW